MPEPGERARRGSALVVALAGAVMLPFVVAAVRVALIKHGYATASDLSIIELRIRDIPLHPPLVGPYSRYGWNHPGPAIYYALAPLYWLASRESVGLLWGALTINCAACVGTVVVARRRGGLALAGAAAVAMLVFLHGFGAANALSTWNPTLPVMPLVLFLALAWSVAVGDAALLPWCALVGSFVAQAHVGLDLTVLVAAGFAATSMGVRWRRGHVRVSRSVLRLSAVVMVAMWAGPAIDALAHRGGNARALVHYFRGKHQRIGFPEAWHIVSGELSVNAQWFRGFVRDPFTAEPFSAYHNHAPLLLVVLLLAVALSTRQRGAGTMPALLLSIATTVAAVVSIASITGVAYDYLSTWVSAVAVFSTIAVAAVALVELRRRRPQWVRAVVGTLAVAALIAAAFGIRQSATFADPSDAAAHLVVRAARVVARSPDVRHGTVMVTPLAGLESGLAGAGMLFHLEDLGVKIGVPANEAFVYGGHRVARDSSHALLFGVSVVEHASQVPKVRPGMQLVVRLDELSPSARARYDGFAVALSRLIAQHRYNDVARLGPVPHGGGILTVWRLHDPRLAPHDSFLGA